MKTLKDWKTWLDEKGALYKETNDDICVINNDAFEYFREAFGDDKTIDDFISQEFQYVTRTKAPIFRHISDIKSNVLYCAQLAHVEFKDDREIDMIIIGTLLEDYIRRA